jgi:hypothetical protein
MQRGTEQRQTYLKTFKKLKKVSGTTGDASDDIWPSRHGVEVPRLYLRHLYGTELAKKCIVLLPKFDTVTKHDEFMPCWYQPYKQTIISLHNNYSIQCNALEKYWKRTQQNYTINNLPNDVGIWIIDLYWHIINEYYYTDTTVGIPISRGAAHALSKYGCANFEALESLKVKRVGEIDIAHLPWKNLPVGENIIYDDDPRRTAVAFKTLLTSVMEIGEDIILADTVQHQIIENIKSKLD